MKTSYTWKFFIFLVVKICIYLKVSGSSPDLVSSRSLGPGRLQQNHNHYHHHHQINQQQQQQQHHYLDPAVTTHQLLPNPEAHRTYTNLAAILDTQHQLPHLDDFRRAFVSSEEPNIVYCMRGDGDVGMLLENRPRSTTVPYHSVTTVSTGSQYATNAPEPIYENVPLPWAADSRVAGNGLRGTCVLLEMNDAVIFYSLYFHWMMYSPCYFWIYWN